MFIFASVISFIILIVIALIPSHSKITLIIKKGLRLEITFALFKLELYDFSDGKGGRRASSALYRRFLSRIWEFLGKCDLTLEELHIPRGSVDPFSTAAFISPYGYHIAISTVIAYLRSNTEKLNIRDNAVILIPDDKGGFSLRLSARTRMIYAIRAVLFILSDKRDTEGKEVKGNVGK